MPIDDALEKIELKEPETKKDEDSGSQIKNSEAMMKKANEIMGEALIYYFQSKLPGQSKEKYDLNEKYIPLIKKLGMNLLTITPGRSKSNARALKHTQIVWELNQEYFRSMTKTLFGDYIFKTDLLRSIEEGMKAVGQLENLIPELKAINTLLIGDHNSDVWREFDLATLHPYIVVMGMRLQYRPLAVLAVKKAINNNQMTFLGNQLPEQSKLTELFIRSKLAEMLPFTNDYLEVAQEYNITEIAPVMKDFNRVCEDYVKNWRQ